MHGFVLASLQEARYSQAALRGGMHTVFENLQSAQSNQQSAKTPSPGAAVPHGSCSSPRQYGMTWDEGPESYANLGWV